MMPSSSQVLDHQLIFHIMYGLGQFHHRQNKGEERRGEERGDLAKKSNSCLTNIERKRCKKVAAASQHIEDRSKRGRDIVESKNERRVKKSVSSSSS